ncbi:MAG: FAD-dependent oxidoreductase [Desulfovibrionaceae bacterium]|nr:FAD-dependent oxidoreductase [Desulfovibrionaceae bacterium]
MGKKVIIVGGMAAGASASARLRRLDEKAEILLLEKGEHISYASCGLPYYVGGVIADRRKLFVQTPEAMKTRFNLDIRTGHELTEISPENRTISVRDLSGHVYEEHYDCLLLCMGTMPIVLDWLKPGPNVFSVRNVADSDALRELATVRRIQSVALIGGGPIGLEMAEIFQGLQLETHIVDLADQVLPALDPDMAAHVHQELRRHNVRLHLGSKAVRAEGGPEGIRTLHLENGESIQADLFILGLGLRPASDPARRAGLKIGATGGIVTDEYLRSSDPFIYAAGDVIQAKNFVSGGEYQFSSAVAATRQGWIAAGNIHGLNLPYKGAQSTFIAKAFTQTAAATGLNEKTLRAGGFPHVSIHLSPSSHASYYPGASALNLKVIFDPRDGRLLGAQGVGAAGVDKRMDVLSTALRAGLNVFELQDLELAYAPPYSTAKDPVNLAGYIAGNAVLGLTEVTHWAPALSGAGENGALLLDVRTDKEFSAGSVPGAYHIALDQLRERCSELPAGREIFVYCLSGLRSYVAIRILAQRGFRVKNISGGYLLYQVLTQDGRLSC